MTVDERGNLQVAVIIGKTTITGPSVGATSTLVLADNPSRKSAKFINDSDEEMYLSRGIDAEMNKGIRLNPNGKGVYVMDNTDLFLGAVYAICTSGSKVLCIEECE